MKVFITGATGFIGRNLVEKLSSRGWRCTCLVRDRVRAEWMENLPGVSVVEGDLLASETYKDLIPDMDYVVHMAGITKGMDRDEYFRVNEEGTRKVVEAFAAGGRRLKKFLYISSLAVAGPRTSERPAVETDNPAPITSYGESKLEGEKHVLDCLGSRPWVILRPPVVYGPYDRDVFLYFRMAYRGYVIIAGNPAMELSIVHVNDLTDGMILSLLKEESAGNVYNISDGGVYTVEEIAGILLELAGRGRIVRVPPFVAKMVGHAGDLYSRFLRRGVLVNSEKVREATSAGWVCGIEKITRELGYAPRVSLREGLETTFRWYLESGWL